MVSFKSILRVLLAFIVLLGVTFGLNPIQKTEAQTVNTFYISPTGSDSTGDGSSSKPWASLSGAQSFLKDPGDTLIVRGGTYNHDYFMSQANGSASAPITIKNATGETPVFYAQNGENFNLRHSYYIIEGLKFMVSSAATSVADFLRLENSGAHHNIVRNSSFIGRIIEDGMPNYQATSPGNNSIVIINNANNNIIQNNIVSITGNYNMDPADPGQANEGNLILINSASSNKILNNVLSKGWHQGISIWNLSGAAANYNEVRGNIVDQTSAGTGIGIQSFTGKAGTAFYNLIENNIVLNAGSGVQNIGYKTGLQLNSSSNTIRGNVFAGYKGVGIGSVESGAPTNNNYIYNNTVYNNKTACFGFSNRDTLYDINLNLINNTLANNICYKNDQRPSGTPTWLYGTIDFVENGTVHQNPWYPNNWDTFAGGNVFKNNLIMRNSLGEQVIQRVDGGWFYTLAQAQSTFPAVFMNNIQGDPLFSSIDPANANFLRLQSTSPAIGKAIDISDPNEARFGKWNGGNPIRDIGAYQSGSSALTLNKSADKTQVKTGDTITYTIQYTATAQANSTVITDTVPANTSDPRTITPPGTVSGGTITWNLGNLAAGTTGSLTFQVTVN